MSRIIDELKRTDHKRYLGGLDFFKYIGPGLLVTVGFIDPGNWASNFAAGSEFGYALLWVVTLSTIMLIVLQHNVAHLGIVTGLCLSEAATQYCPKWISRPILGIRAQADFAIGGVDRDVHGHRVLFDTRLDKAVGFEVLLKVGVEEERRSRAEQD